MKKRLLKQEQFNISRWSGGSTAETAIYPEKSSYLERDFIWRLSTAAVESEESSFTRLPDYERVLMVLVGSVVLAHGDERSASLQQWEQDTFDGALKTKCFGVMTDYNLMYRKGCSGSLKLIDADKQAQMIPKNERDGMSDASYGFYCAEGYVIVSSDGESDIVKQGEQLIIDLEAGEDRNISIMGEGRCVMAEVFYRRARYTAEEIPEQKASFDDFRTAFRLVHSRNKWSQVLRSGKQKGVWHDEALQKKLAFLDRTYVTFIVWLAVLMILLLTMFCGISAKPVAAAMIIWSVIHFLIIAPLIYMIVLPKPIKAHIRKISELTEYERERYETELGNNERVEKLLYKYRAADDENRKSYRDRIKNIFR